MDENITACPIQYGGHRKLNLTQINCNTQYRPNHRKAKSNQQTTFRSVHYVCVLHCAQLLHTILHRTDLISFPLALQTVIIAPMMSI